VHHRRERKEKRQKRAAHKHQPVAPFAGGVQGDRVAVGQVHHQVREEAHQPGALQRLPVHAEDHVEVGGVDGDVGIGTRRAGEQRRKPGQRLQKAGGRGGELRFLHQVRRQVGHERQRDCQHDQEHQPNGPQNAQRGLSALTAAVDLHRQRREPQRRQRQREGLHHDRDAVDDERRLVPALEEVDQRQGEEDGQDRIDLPPGGAVHDRRGQECVEYAQENREPLAQRLPPFGVDHNSRREIHQYRGRLQNQPEQRAVVAQPEGAAQIADQPERVHVPRRIIAEYVRRVEAGRPSDSHPRTPRREIAHIDAVAVDGDRHHRPDYKAHRHTGPQESAQCRLREAVQRAAPAAPGEERHDDEREHRHEEHQLRVVSARVLLAVREVHILPAVRREGGEVEDGGARGRRIDLLHGKFVKPGGAGVGGAVSAQPRHHGQLRLVLAGDAVELDGHPFAIRVVQELRRSEGVLD